MNVLYYISEVMNESIIRWLSFFDIKDEDRL